MADSKYVVHYAGMTFHTNDDPLARRFMNEPVEGVETLTLVDGRTVKIMVGSGIPTVVEQAPEGAQVY